MRSRHGTILLSVLVVVAIASLTGATAMYVARAQAATASVTLKRTQARALAWSGVQAVMAELAEQREALLDGEEPQLTADWELYEDGGTRAIVRLLPLHEDGQEFAHSEAARLNLNTATQEMLTAAGFEAKVAAAIVAGRSQQPYTSVEDLLQIPGITAPLLRGEPGEESDEEAAAALVDRLTVWSFDANVQSGIGADGSQHRGKLRVNLDVAWSDRLAAAVDARFGEGASPVLKSLMEQGTKFKTMGDVVATLRRLNAEPKEWPRILDVFAMSDDPYLPGKVDLSRAPAEVLACIPGLDADLAAQIVQARGDVPSDTRSSPAWPVLQGILTPDQFAKAADHLTTRTLQWRVRIEVGIAGAEQGDEPASTATLRNRMVVEAIIDVASERPRVGYLRDVTMEKAAATLYDSLMAADEEEQDAEDAKETEAPDREVTDSASNQNQGSPQAGRSVARTGGPGPGRNLLLKQDLSSEDAGFGDLDFGNRGNDPPAVPESLQAPEPDPSSPGMDRRLGRWTTGNRGGSR